MNSKLSESEQTSASPFVFEAAGLKKDYDDGQVHALRGVDFQVREGEFVAIVGPSGSGKTTLLQMLGALDRPTAGKLTYRGESLLDLPDPAAYRAHEIGFIFQSFHLLPIFTAIENVQIPMFEDHQSRGARKTRALELLNAVGLAQRVNHFPAKLSGGERQRVAVARSLANSPSVLLADEPTGNLDSENAKHVLDLITSLHRDRRMTLILITHDMSVASRASRAIQMKDGQAVFDGDPAKLSGHG
jgi:ABC-type lipoprotein export system ATPase subunit